MIYEWGSRSFSVKAETVGRIVEDLASQHGGACPPAALVEVSRPEDAPTHRLFTWDDVLAAESWRRHEARNVINSIRVVSEDRKQSAPGFLHVSLLTEDGPREGYSPSYKVVADDSQREQALAEALAALNGWRRRYRHIKELGPVFDAADLVESLVAS